MRYFLLLSTMVMINTAITYAQTIFRVNIEQSPKLELISEKNTLLELGESIELGNIIKVSGGTTPFVFSWSPGIYLTDVTSPNPLATPSNDITYYLIVTDRNNCTVFDSIMVNIQISSDIKNLAIPEIIIYPVPVSNGVLYIRLIYLRKSAQLSILDLYGNLIINKIIPKTENETLITIPLLVKPGTYILKIDSGNSSIVKNFIVI